MLPGNSSSRMGNNSPAQQPLRAVVNFVKDQHPSNNFTNTSHINQPHMPSGVNFED